MKYDRRKHEKNGQVLQSLKGLGRLINLNSFFARDLGLNLNFSLVLNRITLKVQDFNLCLRGLLV